MLPHNSIVAQRMYSRSLVWQLSYYWKPVLCTISLLFLLYLSLWNNKVEDPYHVNLTPLSRPATRSLNITILVVLNGLSDPQEYRYPLNTIQCYAATHQYTLRVVNDTDYAHVCKQKDYMFRRHCISSEVLKTTDWLLFLDADIAIANPTRLIEEWVDETSDITLYDRFTSWEIAMGSYLARNSQWSRTFLREFADFETELPSSFHGTDNGAIHAFLVSKLLSSSAPSAAPCLSIWSQSTGFPTLFLFEACIRAVIGDRMSIDRLRIIPKGRGWVRDIWLTDSEWSPQRDFMLHGTKTSDMIGEPNLMPDFARKLLWSPFAWKPLLREKLDLQECSRGTAEWKFVRSLMVESREVELQLSRIHRTVEKKKWQTLAQVAQYI